MTATIPPVPTRDEPPVSIPSLLAGEWAREVIMSVGASSPRSLQAHLGPSEIGQQCPRRLAYRVLGTPVVNLPDPTKALIGTGFHLAMAEGLRRLDYARARYLIEVPVSYRGISGSVDVYDRFKARVIDFKTSAVKTIRRYRRDGVPVNSKVQVSIYGEALRAQGEQVDSLALIYVPRDGDLSEIYAWVGQPDRSLADAYVDRYLAIAEQAKRDGAASLPATPSPICSWCPNHLPRAVDLTVSCPGKD